MRHYISNNTFTQSSLTIFVAILLAFFSFASVAAPEKPAKAPTVKQQTSQQKAVEKTVNINKASAEEIASALKGVGLKKAQAIVKWREANGQFTSVEQLAEVKGIGEHILQSNKKKLAI